jgi:hypothetical protein
MCCGPWRIVEPVTPLERSITVTLYVVRRSCLSFTQYLENYPDLINLVQCGVDTYIFFMALGLRSLWRSRRKGGMPSPERLPSGTPRTPGSLGVGFEQITVVTGTSYGMWKHYCIIGLMIALNGAAIQVCTVLPPLLPVRACVQAFGVWLSGFQNADPHLSGYLQPLLSSVTVPLTGVFAWYVNGVKLTKFMWFGSIVVIVGLLIAVLPPAFEPQPQTAGDSSTGWDVTFRLVSKSCFLTAVWTHPRRILE